MSSFNLLGLGVQSLTANQSALSVVGQNISNVNTPGYSRQIANLATREQQFGVQVTDIQRITDQFLMRQYWSDNSNFNQAQTLTGLANQLDDLLASSSTSVSTALDNFFLAMQNAVDDPASLPNRELFVSELESMTRRFNELGSALDRQNTTINDQFSNFADEASSIAINIADLNDKIRLASAAGKPANELEDKRDEQLKALSGFMDIAVVPQDSSQVAVFIGNGQPLVIGNSSNRLVSTLGDPDPSQPGLSLMIAGRESKITEQVSGGKLGGLLDYRERMLNPAINELGRIALVLSDTMNEQHQKGMDLDGNLGGRLFRDINSLTNMQDRISAGTKNQSLITKSDVRITDSSKIQASDYQLKFTGANQFLIQRVSDGKQTNMASLSQVSNSADVKDGTYFSDPDTGRLVIGIDGMTINLESRSGFSAQDQFLIQPTRYSATEMAPEVTSGRLLALASPINVRTALDNDGTGVAIANITDINAVSFATAGELNPPVEIRFENTQPLSYSVLDISNPQNPQVMDLGFGPLQNQPFEAGKPILLDGYEVVINNRPEPGDTFSFDYNMGGVSDNRNALALSNLQQQLSIEGGSYQDTYGRLVASVGTRTAISQNNLEASRSVLSASENALSSVSGVNLDEEATKLVQFQQAYQASAQLIRASQTIFDSLLSVV